MFSEILKMAVAKSKFLVKIEVVRFFEFPAAILTKNLYLSRLQLLSYELVYCTIAFPFEFCFRIGGFRRNFENTDDYGKFSCFF